MGNRNFRALLIGAAALALCACGGGSSGRGSGFAPLPLPPPPAQGGAIISGASTSQQFAAIGVSYSFEGDEPLRFGADEQLQVRYVQSSNSYEVQLSHSEAWESITEFPGNGGNPIHYMGDTASLWIRSGDYTALGGYQYSSMFQWSSMEGTTVGEQAIGVATPATAIPVTGSASYVGQLLGHTSEVQSGSDMQIGGSINLAFNFGLGTLSGSISPTLYQDFAPFSLGTFNFTNTVYSVGSPTFGGTFDTDIPGINSFSGLFTGPNAQELIGNFALPYQSPIDGTNQQAAGAFVGSAD